MEAVFKACKGAVCDYLDGIRERLIDLSKFIHANPEIGFQEYKASRLLADELRVGGFWVKLGIANLETAIKAQHPESKEGPVVALLGEYDALPELGHACGHNLMGVASVGAALALGSIKTKLPGTIRFVGAPAEEEGAGKVRLLEAGVFDDVDAAMMFHPGSHTYVDGRSLAMTEITITFRGKSSHAASSPEKGINALDAVIQTFVAINAFREHVKDGARIHGIITDGGRKPNIIPDFAAASFQVRAPENSYRDELVERVRKCAEGSALATGATLSYVVGRRLQAISPNSVLGKAFSQNLFELGLTVGWFSGQMASTDMGDVSCVVPSIQPIIKIVEQDTPFHSEKFKEASVSPMAHTAMIVAAKALAMTTIDLLSDPDLVRSIRVEFEGKRCSIGTA